MSFASELLSDIDSIRAIPDELGLRPFSVVVRVVTWTQGRPGLAGSLSNYTDTPMLTGGGSRPKVRQVTAKDIIASGGLYHAQDMKVGPLTPSYPSTQQNGQGGGVLYSTIDPQVTGATVEIYYGLSGGNLPGEHVWYDKLSDTTDHALNSTLVLRRSAVQNPGGAP